MDCTKFVLKQVQNVLFWTGDWKEIMIIEGIKYFL